MSLLLKLRDSSGCYCCFPTLLIFLLCQWQVASCHCELATGAVRKNKINVWGFFKMFILFTEIYNGLKLIFIFCTPEIAKLQIKCSQIYSLCLLLRKFSNAVLSIQTFVNGKIYLLSQLQVCSNNASGKDKFSDFSTVSSIASCIENVYFVVHGP